MMYWLIPRLARLHADPSVGLRFNMSHSAVDFTRDNVSVGMRLSSIEAPKGVQRNDVPTEWIGPVSSPAYLGVCNCRPPPTWNGRA